MDIQTALDSTTRHQPTWLNRTIWGNSFVLSTQFKNLLRAKNIYVYKLALLKEEKCTFIYSAKIQDGHQNGR